MLQGPCARTQDLLRRITARRTLYMCPALFHGQAVIRFVVCSRLTELEDVQRSWAEIVSQAEAVLEAENHATAPKTASIAAASTPSGSCDPRGMAKNARVVHNMLGQHADAQHTV